MCSHAKMSKPSKPTGRGRVPGRTPSADKKSSNRQGHIFTGRTEEYLAFLFKLAKIKRDPWKRALASELQSATDKVVPKFRRFSRQTVADVLVCCCKLGKVNPHVSKSLVKEIHHALSCLGTVGTVNPDFRYQVYHASRCINEGNQGRESGVGVYQTLLRSTKLVLEKSWSAVYSRLVQIRNGIPEPAAVSVLAPDDISVDAIRKQAQHYQRHRTVGHVRHKPKPGGRQSASVALHMSWVLQLVKSLLNQLVLWMEPPSKLHAVNESTASRRDPKPGVASDRYGLQDIFTNEQLVSMLHSLTAARYIDPHLLDLIVLHLLAQVQISDQTMRSLVEALYSCSRLAHNNLDLVNQILMVLHQKGGWKLVTVPDDACKILWSLSVMGQATPELLELGATRMRWLGKNGGKFSCTQRRQLAQVRAVVGGASGRFKNCNKLLKKWFKRATTCSSGFHQRIGDMLKELGYSHQKEVCLGNGVVTVDVALVKHKVVVEADGPMHYSVNEVDGRYQMLGTTILRNKVIESLGWKVVDIPFFEWETMAFPKRHSYLKQKVDAAICVTG